MAERYVVVGAARGDVFVSEPYERPRLGLQEAPPTGNNALFALAMLLLIGACVFMVTR